MIDARATREFFYVEDNGTVVETVGYECVGTSGYWWCPSIGVSAAEGHSLFRDRVDAYDAAHTRALHRLQVARANLERIEEERWL